jgi:hypothetical protein
MRQLRGQKENTYHVTATCCYLTQRGHKENTASPIVAWAYFGRDLEMMSLYCCVLEQVYGAVAWQRAFTLQHSV